MTFIGRELGDYRIVEPIGAGGMGEVYLAEHVHLRKKYAVKILPTGLAQDKDFVARFYDEARVMADLHHPHIVQVHAMSCAEGVYFLVMDYVTGPEGKPLSLHEHLKQQPDGRLPEAQVRKWAIQIAEALHYAHERGVVHRDLKPANILLDENGDAKLTDFGLAKAIGSEFILSQIHTTMQHSLGSRPTLRSPHRDEAQDTLDVAATIPEGGSGGRRSSSASSILGTYDYMAPEQRGEGTGRIDQRTDIYSFGVVLYRLLTGKRPTGFAKSPSQIVPGISKRWDLILPRCIAEDPAERYQSTAELLANVRVAWTGRRRPLLIVAAAIPLLIAGALWIGSLARTDPGDLPAEAVSQARPEVVDGSLPEEAQPSAMAPETGDVATPPNEPADSVGDPIEVAPAKSAVEASQARIEAMNARQAAKSAEAETHAPEFFAAADRLLKRGEAHDTLEAFADAAAKYEEAREGFLEAEQIGKRLAAEVAGLREARESMERVKGEADRLHADTLAKVRYEQASKLERQAREASDRATATGIFGQAEEYYSLASREAAEQAKAIVASKRQEAEAAQGRATTASCRKYAPEELSVAQGLMQEAERTGDDYAQAEGLFKQAKAKFEEAVRVTGEREVQITELLSTARKIVDDAGFRPDERPPADIPQRQREAAVRAKEKVDTVLALDRGHQAASELLQRLELWTKLPPPREPEKSQKRRSPEELVSQLAPSFTIQTLAGRELSERAFGESVATVLNFPAANCGYSKKQIPRVEKIRQNYEGQGVRFVNIVQTMRKELDTDEVVKIMRRLGSNLELAHDPNNSVGKLFHVRAYPSMVVVGKDGKIVAANVGNLGDLEKRLEGQLDALIEGKPVPKVAQEKSKPRRRPVEDLVGMPAPKFSFTTLKGATVNNDTLKLHPATVINVIASNCGFSKKQTRRLEIIRAEYEAKGVRFVNLVQTMRNKMYTPKEAVEIFKKAGSNIEIAHDPDNTVGPLFKARSFPTMLVLGKSGKVEAVNVGNIGDLETRVKGQLDALIAGKPVPKIASKKSKSKPQRKRPDDLVGTPAPQFALETLEGKPVSQALLSQSPATVLNFVATNCGYCGKQIPRLETLRAKYADKGVRFVTVYESMRKRATLDEINAKIDALGWQGEVAHDPDNKIGPLFNATGFPTMIVLGRSGKVEAVNVGNIGDLETRLKKQLDALIEGKPVPKVAPKKSKSRRRPAEELVGTPAPAFSLTTHAGKSVSSNEFKNHPATVLNFVAPNCGFCKRQIPNVEKVRATYEAKGVRFVNLQQKMRKEYSKREAARIFKDVGSNLELATDEGNKVGKAYKAVSFPTMVVINRQGKIVHVNIGAKKDLETILKQQLDAILRGG